MKALKQMAKEVNFLISIICKPSFHWMIKNLLVNCRIDYMFKKSMLSLLKLAFLVIRKERCLDFYKMFLFIKYIWIIIPEA